MPRSFCTPTGSGIWSGETSHSIGIGMRQWGRGDLSEAQAPRTLGRPIFARDRFASLSAILTGCLAKHEPSPNAKRAFAPEQAYRAKQRREESI